MTVEIGAEAALFPEKEYINGIAVAVQNTRNFILTQNTAPSHLHTTPLFHIHTENHNFTYRENTATPHSTENTASTHLHRAPPLHDPYRIIHLHKSKKKKVL